MKQLATSLVSICIRFCLRFFILTEIPPYLLYPGPLQILDTGSQIYWEMKQQDVSTEKNAGKKNHSIYESSRFCANVYMYVKAVVQAEEKGS